MSMLVNSLPCGCIGEQELALQEGRARSFEHPMSAGEGTHDGSLYGTPKGERTVLASGHA